jgi:integrase
MRRKRFLKGSLRARKHGRQKVWLAQWWEDGSRRTKILGRYSEISKSEAEVMLTQIVQPLNKEAGISQVPLFTFKHYVESKFLPVCRRMWKESTRTTSESNIIRYLLPAFQKQRLEAITREQMQTFLEEISGDLTASVVGHLRWHLNAIFKMAQSDGIVSHNPAGALYIPECKRSPTKRVMSPHQVRTALGVLDLRPRVIFRLAIFSGLRPGEIFAIRLGKIGDTSITIDQRVYEGKLDSPKGRKGKDTTRIVGLTPTTASEIELWRSFLQNREGDAYLFPSETLVTPLRPNNLWKREIQPRLEVVGLGWVNFQVLRRTNASLSRKANVDDKVSADQRGHGLGVSMSVYAISDLEQKVEAVTKLEAEVTRPESADFQRLELPEIGSLEGSGKKTE